MSSLIIQSQEKEFWDTLTAQQCHIDHKTQVITPVSDTMVTLGHNMASSALLTSLVVACDLFVAVIHVFIGLCSAENRSQLVSDLEIGLGLY